MTVKRYVLVSLIERLLRIRDGLKKEFAPPTKLIAALEALVREIGSYVAEAPANTEDEEDPSYLPF